MESIKAIFGEHYQWVFSGIGVFILSLFVTIIYNWFTSKGENGINISTKGHNSPGFVGRDFKVGKDDKDKY